MSFNNPSVSSEQVFITGGEKPKEKHQEIWPCSFFQTAVRDVFKVKTSGEAASVFPIIAINGVFLWLHQSKQLYFLELTERCNLISATAWVGVDVTIFASSWYAY